MRVLYLCLEPYVRTNLFYLFFPTFFFRHEKKKKGNRSYWRSVETQEAFDLMIKLKCIREITYFIKNISFENVLKRQLSL